MKSAHTYDTVLNEDGTVSQIPYELDPLTGTYARPWVSCLETKMIPVIDRILMDDLTVSEKVRYQVIVL